MRTFINIILIVGFLFVDFLFFHDVFKRGETITAAQCLTGLLSIPVIVMSIQSLLHDDSQPNR